MPAKPPDHGGDPGKAAKLSQNKPSAKPFSTRPCPICGKPAIEASKPFCSERCRDVDLNRWLSNSYAIPGKPEDDQDAE
ncbi:MAG: DNA gyrase inhibitor YacG [Bradyrhizobium sp.]